MNLENYKPISRNVKLLSPVGVLDMGLVGVTH